MLLTIITFFAILGLLVLVHEWGHFVTARRFGVKVEEFGLGLPPRIFGFFKNDQNRWEFVGLKTKIAPKTLWSLNWIPLGGFVKIKGEDGGDVADPNSFASKKVWQRIIVLSAGVSMNLLLAIVIFSIGLTIGSPQAIDQNNISKFAQVKDAKIRIAEVLPGSPAEQAGLKSPDAVVQIDGQSITSIEQLQALVADKVGQSVAVVVDRNGESLAADVTPQILEETGKAGLGVALVETGLVSYPWYVAPVFAVREVFNMVVAIVVGFFTIIQTLLFSGKLIGEVYGPVGIAGLVGDATKLGFLYVMQFTAVLSVIIAVINFLPFPALDGGRVVFLMIEGLRGKPVNQKFEAAAHNIGFALLMLLILVVTYNDIVRVSGGLLQLTSRMF